MDPATYARAQAIFEEVCDLDPVARAERLAELCGDDADLLRQVEALLSADLASSWVLDGPLAPEASSRLVDYLASGEEPALPESIGEYRVVGLLGEGGMGVVYETEQSHPRRLVAVKCLHPWMQSTELREHFHAEAQLMGQLLHPGVPQVYGAGEQDGCLWLAMERVEGKPLDALEGVGLRQGIDLLIALCDAVEHAHQRGVVHCDLKPSNVLVTPEGQPKVLDFGIARLWMSGEQALPPGRTMGTPQYMGPEQLLGEGEPHPTWDVFSLGVLGWQLLTGFHPYAPRSQRDRARLAALIRGGPRPLGLGRSLMAEDVEAVLRKALDYDPEQRYASAAALGADLLRVRWHRPVSARPPRLAYLGHTWLRRNQRMLVGAGLSLGAVLVLGLAFEGGRAWVEHQQAEQREVSALTHWESTREHMHSLWLQDRPEEEEGAFLGFVDSPAHQGTQAAFEAWIERAEQLRARADWEGELEALGAAWSVAPSPVDEVEALTALARVYARRWEWEKLASVLGLLRDQGATLRSLELEHALAVRDLSGAVELMDEEDPRRPLAQALSVARPSPLRAGGQVVDDLDGDGLVELFGPMPWGLDVLTGRGEHTRVELPGEGRVAWASWVPAHRTLVVQHADVEEVRLYPVLPEHLAGQALEPAYAFPLQGMTVAREADLDGDGVLEVYVAAGAYSRRLVRLDRGEDGWSRRVAHARTDAASSDISVMDLVDLDGDGRQELALAASFWAAWDLRVLGASPGRPGLELRARERLGVVRPLLALDTPAGPSLFAVRREHGSESPPVQDLWQLHHGSLRSVWTRELTQPTPGGVRDIRQGVVIDLDGDGLDDVAYTLTTGGRDHALILRQLPGGDFSEPLILADAWVVGGHESEGERWLAIYDIWRQEQWLLGSGEEVVSQVREDLHEEVPLPSSLARVRTLRALGLNSAAAELAERLAQGGAPPHLALCTAGDLWSGMDRQERALGLYEQALRLAPDHSPALRGRARSLTALERWSEAAAAWEEVGGSEAEEALAWLRPLQEPMPQWDARAGQPLSTVWRILDPLAVRRPPLDGVLLLDSWAEGGGDLAALSLEIRGGHAVVEGSLELSQPEMGSNLLLILRVDEEPLLWWKVGIFGGGGRTRRAMGVGTGAEALRLPKPEPAVEVDPASWEEHLHLHFHLVPSTGMAEVRAESDLAPELVWQGRVELPEGPVELVFAQTDQPPYGTPMRLRARVTELHLEGLVPVDPGPRDASFYLADGESDRALEAATVHQPLVRALALLDLGRHAEAADVVAAALRADHPRSAALVEVVSPELGTLLHQRLGSEWLEHWYRAHRTCLSHLDHPRCAASLGAEAFGRIPGDTPAQRELLLHHADWARITGRLALAEVDLRRLLEVIPPEEPRLAERAWLSMARVAWDQGELHRYEEALTRAITESPTPELAMDRVEEIRRERSAEP